MHTLIDTWIGHHVRNSLAACLLILPCLGFPAVVDGSESKITQEASSRCAEKVRLLQENAEKKPPQKQSRKVTQEEINSFLALDLSSKYHPSLKSLEVTIEESKLKATASIDFDQINARSASFATKLLAKLLSGVHRLSVKGKFIAQDGKARLQVEDSRFDEMVLPRVLVEEIISMVGRKQRPPIDPIHDSQMPYGIQSVDLHAGYIVVHQ